MFNSSLFGESRTELVARLDTADTFTRWVQLVPELAAEGTVSSVAEVLAALEPGTERTRWDGLLLALLQLAAVDGADQADAVFVVLQAVAAGAARLLRRSTTPSRRGARPDFTEGLVLGQLTIQIRSYPWRTRTRAVAANLLLDTEHALCREVYAARFKTRRRAEPVVERPVDMRRSVDATPVYDEVGPDVADAAGLELVDLLMWAERTGVVAARDLSMLVEYHYARELTGAGHEHVARTFGVNVRTSKRRVAAALEALQAAAPQYLAS
jgi:hypothetical protein